MNPLEQYTLQELKLRTSEKWENYPSDILPLWVAEMDNKIPVEISNALIHSIETSNLGYLSTKRFNAYRESFGKFAKRHWDWNPNPKSMFYMTDVVSGIRSIIETYLGNDKSANVITSTPIYPPFITRLPQGYNLIDTPLSNEGRLNFDIIEKEFHNVKESGHRSVYLLCNPHNPTGTIHSLDELRQLAYLSKQYDILIISDEIHAQLISSPSEDFTPFQKISNTNSITVTSCSKAYSIPGIKCALAITSNQQNFNRLASSPKIIKGGGEHLSVLAQTVGYTSCDIYLKDLTNTLEENINYFSNALKKYFPKAIYNKTYGTYFAWVDFSSYFTQTQNPSKYFLEFAKVALNDGATFGTNYKHFVRFNLATRKDIIKLACEKIGESLIALEN